jgi:hypothetical protein
MHTNTDALSLEDHAQKNVSADNIKQQAGSLKVCHRRC